jgi:hypothetical protein
MSVAPFTTPFSATSTAAVVVAELELTDPSGRTRVVESWEGRWTSSYMAQAAERFHAAGSALKTTEQGAATPVLLAASPLLDGIGGRYFENCNEAPIVSHRGEAGLGGLASYALDHSNAKRLWDLSLHLVD